MNPRSGSRLVSRAALEAPAPQPALAPSRSSPPRARKPSPAHSAAPLSGSLSRHSACAARWLRKLWKRVTQDSSGKRSRVGHMIAAFKMGLYFKLLITLLLLVRFASHSSQRTYPSGSVLRHTHLYNVASAAASPAMRIVVLCDGASAEQLRALLHSLSKADYDRDAVALDVWLFASSLCDYFPLPLYPLAMAVFGPPRFDHALAAVVQAAAWAHGHKTLIAHRAEGDVSQVWEASRGAANESVLFVDASVASAVSPAFYTWLRRTRHAIDRGMIANAGVLSLDAVVVPDVVPTSDRAVMLQQFFPASSAFSPTQDVWVTFLVWHALRARRWFARPALRRLRRVGGYDVVRALRADPARAWFAQFVDAYGERVVHPVLPDGGTLVVRAPRTTGGRAAGGGLDGYVRLDARAEVEANLFEGTLRHTAVPEQPVLVRWDDDDSTAGAGGRARSAAMEHVVGTQGARLHAAAVRRIGEFARSRGTAVVALTMVTAEGVQTAMSWLCNVAALDIAPAAVVMLTSEQRVADELTEFMREHRRLQQGSLILALEGVGAGAGAGAGAQRGAGRDGRAEHWAVELQRAFVVRDVLAHGVWVLLFETDQMWLSDPMPYVEHELRADGGGDGDGDGGGGGAGQSAVEEFGVADVVASGSGGEIGWGFVLLRSSVRTRELMGTVVERLFEGWRAGAMEEEQAVVAAVAGGGGRRRGGQLPRVKVRELNKELFVDGRWFLDFEDERGGRVAERRFYTSESSLYPVVLRNNAAGGAEARRQRARRFGLWFVRGGAGGRRECDAAAVRRAARSGSAVERREARVVELGTARTQL